MVNADMSNIDLLAEYQQSQREESSKSSDNSNSPMPLMREMPPPERFPVEALGGTLAPAAETMHKVIQAPDGVCAQSILAGAALTVQSRRNLVIDGRKHPISENFLSISESGERKTAADAEALKPHREYEKKLNEKFNADLKDYEIEFAAYKSARDEALRKGKTREQKRAALEQVGEPPERPLQPMLIAEEPTYEGLVKFLEIGQPSLGLFSDEGGRLIGGHGMNQDNVLKTVTGLSELWDGKRVSRVRGGDGASLLYGKRLSMHLMVQPIIAQSILSNEIFNQQGFLTRFLISWPEGMAGNRPYQATDLSENADLQKYRSRVRQILEQPLLLAEGTINELQPAEIRLDRVAKSRWVKFHDSTERKMAKGQAFESIKPYASKIPQHVLRLAAILKLIDAPETDTIDLDYLEAGIELAEFYLSENLRILHAYSLDPNLALAEKLLAWAQQFDHIYLQKIYQYGPNAIRDSATAKRIVKVLEEHGWFIRLKGSFDIDGSKRRGVWRVIK